MGFKWAGILVAVLAAALDAMANLLLATLTPYSVPDVVNLFAVALASVAALSAVVAHAYTALGTRLDLVTQLLLGRLEEMQTQVGDRNSGFVEGYLLRPETDGDASVVPLTPRGGGRRSPA